MIPVRDHNPSQSVPYVTYALIAANVLIFLSYGFDLRGPAAAFWFGTFAAVPQEVLRGEDLQGVVTSMFLHAGWMHLAGNMLFLWIFGDNLEDQLGPVRYLGFYLLGGVLATLAHIYAAPTSFVPLVGASGAIGALMGGYLLLFPRARVDIILFLVVYIKFIPVPAWVMLGLWFAFQVGMGVIQSVDAAAVAYWAHAGGFVAGFVMMIPWWLRRGGPRFWRSTQMQPPHAEATYARSHIPRAGRKRR